MRPWLAHGMGRAGGLVMGWFVLFMAATGLFAVGWEFGKLRRDGNPAPQGGEETNGGKEVAL